MRSAPASAFERTLIMTKEQKVIRAKVGLLELARQLGASQTSQRASNPSSSAAIDWRLKAKNLHRGSPETGVSKHQLQRSPIRFKGEQHRLTSI